MKNRLCAYTKSTRTCKSDHAQLWHDERILHVVAPDHVFEIIDPVEVRHVVHNTCTLVVHYNDNGPYFSAPFTLRRYQKSKCCLRTVV